MVCPVICIATASPMHCREKNIYFIQKCEGMGMKHEHGVRLGPGTNGCIS